MKGACQRCTSASGAMPQHHGADSTLPDLCKCHLGPVVQVLGMGESGTGWVEGRNSPETGSKCLQHTLPHRQPSISGLEVSTCKMGHVGTVNPMGAQQLHWAVNIQKSFFFFF